MNKDLSVTIMGCGLSGMLTALALAKIGINTTIIEPRSIELEDFCNDQRTTALTNSSVQFLQKISIWENLEEVTAPILDIYVADNKMPSMIHFALDDAPNNSERKAMGHIIQNSKFKHLLLKEVQNSEYIKIIDNCRYERFASHENHSILALENGSLLRSDLLILCNKPFSDIHQTYFTSKVLKNYGQTSLIFNVRHLKSHQGTAVEHFLSSGPFAILPLQDSYSSNIVWTLKDSYAKLLLKLPKQEFEYLVQNNFGEFLGQVYLDSEVASYPLMAYIADKYFHEKIVLVADTAHIVHPLAGQGLNQGIKDIEVLAQLLGEHKPLPLILEQYQNLRYQDNINMYRITDYINRIFSSDSKMLRYFRQLGFELINKIPVCKNYLVKYAMGQRWK